MGNIYHQEVYRNHLIKVEYDYDAPSPRDMYDNICTMNCYHSRYSVGDNGCKGKASDDLKRIISDYIETKELLKLIKECSHNVKITHNNRCWCLYERYDENWHLYGEYPMADPWSVGSLLANAIELMPIWDLFEVVDYCSTVAISKIYGYDHGGLSISLSRTGCYADRWDSGVLGFIWVTKQKMMEEFKDLTDANWLDKVYDVMASETNEYNSYLIGECYGWEVFYPTAYEDDDEEEGEATEWEDDSFDSCWGYIGNADYVIQEAKDAIDIEIKRIEERKAKAEAERLRRCKVINEYADKIVGYNFIIGNELYEINTNNLMEYPQIEVFPGDFHYKGFGGRVVKLLDLDRLAVDVIYNYLEKTENIAS